MVEKLLDKVRPMQRDWQTQQDDEYVSCSVGIMAHNEEANIGHAIRAVLEQQCPSVRVMEVIVVASGCTDRTVPTVAEIARQEPRVRLCIQEKREGKASAINLFLKQAISPVVVLMGADILPEASALEHLCTPLTDPKNGMVGGRPIPVNDPVTFMGHAVHLLWYIHDRLARVHPKLGEVIAFRNVISGIPTDSPVDEISIQALISQLGYQLIYEPACIVYNKGPLTIPDFLKQRRRIYAGHLQVRDQQNYEASTMKAGPLAYQLIACRNFTMSTPQQAMWTLGTIILEGVARMLGYYDYLCKREHHIWQMVDSTKNLEAGRYIVQHGYNALSILVFRFILESAEGYEINPAIEERQATEVARKLLPLLRTQLLKEDKLSISGPGIMTAVIRSEQNDADLVAQRIQEIVQTMPVHIRGRETRVKVAYSSLTFASKVKNRSMTTSPLLKEAMIAAQVPGSEGNLLL